MTQAGEKERSCARSSIRKISAEKNKNAAADWLSQGGWKGEKE